MDIIRTFLAKDIGISLLNAYKGTNVNYFLNLYISSLNWSRDEIENYQVKRIYELLEHAYNNVPFYKKRFDDTDFNWKSFKYLDQLEQIPPLTRNDLQFNQKDLIAKNIDIDKCQKNSSSGSTGVPVVFYHDKDAFSANRAAGIFSKLLGGYKLGDPWVNIWGNPATVNKEWKKLSSKVSRVLSNEKRFPAYLFKERKGLADLFNLSTNFHPKFLYGYTNALYVFARFMEEENLKLPSIKAVFPTAETLLSYQKYCLENVFGKVYDQYGCSEINGIACETIYDNTYSIIEPRALVEYGEAVDNVNNIRKTLVTDFYNKAFPFIRYEIGDIVVPYTDFDFNLTELHYKKIKSVEGRIKDIIRLPSGGSLVVPNIISPSLLRQIEGIQQYQIILEEEKKMLINIVTDKNFKEDSKKIISNYVKDYFTDELKCEVVLNREIIKSNTGKFKLFIDLTQQ